MSENEVFLSWSGLQAGAIADCLKSFFGDVLQIELFMSRADIAGGGDWVTEVREALGRAAFGMVVLTPANVHSPWLHYEFGALRAASSRRCVPLLFGGLAPERVSGPFQQAQAERFSREGFLKIVEEMHRDLCGSRFSPADVDRRFAMCWGALEEGVSTALAIPELPALVERTRLPAIPPTLERLRQRWEARGGLERHGDFKMHTLCGMHEHTRTGEPTTGEDLEVVYYLWADAEEGSTIAVRILHETPHGARLRVRFDNAPYSAPSNVAVRPSGMTLRRPDPPAEHFAELSFEVRIPPDRESGDLEEVQLAVRIIDAMTTHWEHRKREVYYPHRLAASPEDPDAWRRISIALETASWEVFESDGNWLYADERPDLSAVLAVVIEFGSPASARPSTGRGTVELRSFVLA